MSLTRNIAQFVSENKIPRKQLAEKIGMTETALSHTLNGKRKLLADEYIRICNALCLPYSKFTESNETKAS